MYKFSYEITEEIASRGMAFKGKEERKICFSSLFFEPVD
jgi:hypothetical protein